VSYSELVQRFRQGTDTPRDLLERCLSTIESRDDELHAFACLAVARARLAADASTQRWRSGNPRSEIDGMPVGIKDIIETHDMPTGMGTPLYDGWMSRRDAASVQALRAAGAVIVGKTKTTEFAGSHPCDTRNPHAPGHTAGGSSAGSAAAVGAGMLPIALGTQVVGSILRPASFCGVVGYKPTEGGIHRGGSHDFQSHSCIGLLGATLDDVWLTARVLARMAGGDPGKHPLHLPDGTLNPVRPSTLTWLRTPGWPVASEEARQQLMNFLGRLRSAGVRIISAHEDAQVAAFESLLEASFDVCTDIVAYESRWFARNALERDAQTVSPTLAQVLARAEALTADDYAQLLERRQALRNAYDTLAASRRAPFLTLSATGAAPQGILHSGNPIFNVHASLLGVPALSLPLLSDQSMPLGVQLIGARHDDATLFSTAAFLSCLSA